MEVFWITVLCSEKRPKLFENNNFRGWLPTGKDIRERGGPTKGACGFFNEGYLFEIRRPIAIKASTKSIARTDGSGTTTVR